MRDDGRSIEAALWEEASNCRKLLRTKSLVVNVSVKRRNEYVKYGLERRAQANLWVKHRKEPSDDIETGDRSCPGISAKGTYLLFARCPVQRRRDSNLGSCTELENLVCDAKGKGTSGHPRGRKYRYAGQGRTAK